MNIPDLGLQKYKKASTLPHVWTKIFFFYKNK